MRSFKWKFQLHTCGIRHEFKRFEWNDKSKQTLFCQFNLIFHGNDRNKCRTGWCYNIITQRNSRNEISIVMKIYVNSLINLISYLSLSLIVSGARYYRAIFTTPLVTTSGCLLLDFLLWSSRLNNWFNCERSKLIVNRLIELIHCDSEYSISLHFISLWYNWTKEQIHFIYLQWSSESVRLHHKSIHTHTQARVQIYYRKHITLKHSIQNGIK